MAKAIPILCAQLLMSACGGSSSSSPVAPAPVPAATVCSSETQCILDGATMTVTVDGGVVDGAVASIRVGSSYTFRIEWVRPGPGAVWGGLLFVRDDGVERFFGCFGGGGLSGGGRGSFFTPLSVAPNDAVLTPGHSVSVTVVAAFEAFAPGPGLCPLRSTSGQLSRAAVEGERHLATFVVQ